jgi:hypothetical protein
MLTPGWLLGLHLGVQLVQVGQARHIAVDRADVPADLGLGLVEFGLAAAGDEDVGAFVACGCLFGRTILRMLRTLSC